MSDAALELVDIGANLSHSSFRKDLDEVLEEAARVGVQTLIVTGANAKSAVDGLALARRHPERLRATAGFHPHHAAEWHGESEALLRELAADPLLVSVGETGLDFYRDISPRPVQERVFERHLELACELKLPVFLHQREAHERFRDMVRAYRDDLVDGIAHCFTGDRRMLHEYLDLGLHIGITGWVCDERRGQALRECVADIPLDRLMIETDCPYLMPRTIRPRPKTRRNVPAHLPYVLDEVATLTGHNRATIARATTTNARRFFRL
ncbi:TatD family hydrolase [Alkalilimnicola ehrlichii MLHE-1]|uniref:Sec-independent protein translocase TatD n=1 Tax=Alkalilimnicola ehrlichii (strain ATCC BAA-1101 / DSM 17681 / MLHE-1) TaxID=187272 RepID=Q0A8B1_ALKEH|nr:Sec-independent protein translocase TatD [Alkalilimnicola ehrlichii MLHE-1]